MTNKDGEVREITDEDMKHFMRFEDLPGEMQAKLREIGGPQKKSIKERISICGSGSNRNNRLIVNHK